MTPAVKKRIEHLIRSTGWVPDPPSPGDFTADHPEVVKLLVKTALGHRLRGRRLPGSTDLRPFCSPVQFQGHYNTCTAHVVTSMMALLENRAHGRYVPASRLFLYQVTKRILGEAATDPGVYLRQMMGCVVLIGVPPETYFPYLDTTIDDDPRLAAEPDAFCFAIAHDLRAVRYVRLDPLGEAPATILERIRSFLATGFAASIGFPLFRSALERSLTHAEMPLPKPGEKAVGSHAVLLVGYDDQRKIAGTKPDGESATGAFLFKNSWDTKWGDQGYGWLPYRYLLDGLAHDVWTLIQAAWVDTQSFQIDWATPTETSG